MKFNHKITTSAFLALLTVIGMEACTADHAYKTTITPENYVESKVKSYESDFFREPKKNSIITVNLDPNVHFDQFKLLAQLEDISEQGEEVIEMKNPLILITDSQNRTMNNPWTSLNDSIAYRIHYYYLPNQLHLKAEYTTKSKDDRRNLQFYTSGLAVSQETAEESGLMPIWDKMMAIARQYGDDISIE